LSLTLRDAQHLSWKTFKKIEERIALKGERAFSLPIGTQEFVKKANVIAQTIKDWETSEDKAASASDLQKQLSELLFAAFVLAEKYGIDLEEAFLENIDEFILGFVS
jgi:hypothetical protein